MKKHLLLLFFMFSLVGTSQNKIMFDYDAAGNQVIRQICITCKTTAPTKDLKDLVAEDYIPLQSLLNEDQISYYPNPVKEQLFLKWELINNRTVKAVIVFMINGQMVQTYQNTSDVQMQTIGFADLPAGVYLILMQYSDGKEKTFKIIKK